MLRSTSVSSSGKVTPERRYEELVRSLKRRIV
jgi:hypothetical protein